MVQVVAHFHDLSRAFGNAARLTAPDGCWLIETWDSASWTARVLGAGWHEYSPPSVLQVFSRASLRGLCARMGSTRSPSGGRGSICRVRMCDRCYRSRRKMACWGGCLRARRRCCRRRWRSAIRLRICSGDCSGALVRPVLSFWMTAKSRSTVRAAGSGRCRSGAGHLVDPLAHPVAERLVLRLIR